MLSIALLAFQIPAFAGMTLVVGLGCYELSSNLITQGSHLTSQKLTLTPQSSHKYLLARVW